jgi:hypothetical protein
MTKKILLSTLITKFFTSTFLTSETIRGERNYTREINVLVHGFIFATALFLIKCFHGTKIILQNHINSSTDLPMVQQNTVPFSINNINEK